MARDFSIEIITSLLFGVKINHIIGFTHSIRAAMIHVISKKESQAMKGDFNFSLNSRIGNIHTHTHTHTHTHLP
jgi:hypothetical protein